MRGVAQPGRQFVPENVTDLSFTFYAEGIVISPETCGSQQQRLSQSPLAGPVTSVGNEQEKCEDVRRCDSPLDYFNRVKRGTNWK